MSSVVILLVVAFTSRAIAAVSVSESDLAVYQKLGYAEALFDARKMFLRADKARVAAAQVEIDKMWAESGWTRDRYSEVEDAINEVFSNLSMMKSGELSEADAKSALGECDAVTVATVRAHYAEIDNPGYNERAEKQVREEIARERAGDVPTEAQLRGTWVLDIDATLQFMGVSDMGAETEKLKADLVARVGSVSYTFGPGNTMESRSKGTDGQERVDKGVYRLDGHSLFMRGVDSKKEYELQVGMREGRLQLGMSFGASIFTRQ